MLVNWISGSSSLLFIISAIKACYSSSLISWKLSNIVLVGASFLCNVTEYNPMFLLLDYLTIYLVCISYINNIYINVLYSLLLIYEYKTYNSIENIKNMAFLSAIGKSIVYTYLYVDNYHYNILILSSISGIIIYKIRYLLYQQNNKNYVTLTWGFHICVMNIMYISSITAN
jgi:hypothetical protein